MRLFIMTLSLVISCSSLALEMTKSPPSITLQGETGGKVDGSAWISDSIKGDRPCVLMYVDPDEKEKNEHVGQALKKAFPPKTICSIAVINMAASWLPDFLLQNILEEKQVEFPNTLYVKDLQRVLVKRWGLADEDYHVIAFDRAGKLIFSQAGKLSDETVETLIATLKKSLN